MGALGHYFEEEGLATTQVSLVREHTAAIKPPRALWVPFILGRPFGVPGDAAFQRRVLLAALVLLEAQSGPVLEGFPEDAPRAGADESEAFACPVNFGGPVPAEGETDLAAALAGEIAALKPWHDLAVERRGRSTAGLSGLAVEDAARFLVSFVADPATPSYRADLAAALALRLACEDLKAYYFEAVGAQPGARAAAESERWFWRDTIAGKVFFELERVCASSADESVRVFGTRHLIPRAVARAPGNQP